MNISKKAASLLVASGRETSLQRASLKFSSQGRPSHLCNQCRWLFAFAKQAEFWYTMAGSNAIRLDVVGKNTPNDCIVGQEVQQNHGQHRG